MLYIGYKYRITSHMCDGYNIDLRHTYVTVLTIVWVYVTYV